MSLDTIPRVSRYLKTVETNECIAMRKVVNKII